MKDKAIVRKIISMTLCVGLVFVLVACNSLEPIVEQIENINIPNNNVTISSGTLEGSYYRHENGRSVRVITFNDNRFVQYIEYTEFMGFDLDGVYDMPHAQDFNNAVATFRGSITIDENARRIRLNFDDTAHTRQTIYDIFTHPLMRLLEEETQDYVLSSEWLDELVRDFSNSPIEFSYEDGFDILYEVSFNWDGSSRINYFSGVLIRQGLSISILDNVGGDERLGYAALIGRWTLPNDNRVRFEFLVDGTVIRNTFPIGTSDVWTSYGTWTTRENQLTMDFGEHSWTGDFNFRVSDNRLNIEGLELRRGR